VTETEQRPKRGEKKATIKGKWGVTKVRKVKGVGGKGWEGIPVT